MQLQINFIMSNTQASSSIFNLLNSIRGQFSIYELEETLISLVFLRYIKKNQDYYKLDESVDLFTNTYLDSEYRLLNGNIDLNNIFNKIERDNPEFEGTFSSFDFNSKFKNKDFKKVVFQLIKLLASLDFHNIDFGQFLDYLLKSIIDSKGKKFDSYQPKELSNLMLYLMPKKQHLTVYNPFSGFASLGLNLPKDSLYYGEEINSKAVAYSKLRLLAYRVENKNIIKNIDVFQSWIDQDERFDFIVANPPFNLKLSSSHYYMDVDDKFYTPNNANSFIISQCYKRIYSEKGRAVIAISNGFLNSQNTKEKALREYLIKDGGLEMVISLPAGILNYTSIPFALLVLSNRLDKREPIFVDTRDCFKEVSRNSKILDLDRIYTILNSDNKFKKQVGINEIIDNDFSFVPARYLSAPTNFDLELSDEIKTLGSLIELVARQRPEPGAKGRFIRISDLSDNVLTYQKDFSDIEILDIPSSGTGSASVLPNNKLLVSLRWKTLKPTFYTKSDSEVFYPSYSISAFSVNETLVNVDYLVLELDKEYVIKQIEAERMGSSIPFISKERLLAIKIRVPSLEQQKTDFKLVKDTIVDAKLRELGLEEQFGQLKKEQIEDLSLKKHNIMQHLNNMKSSLDSLTLFMKQNNGVLEADKVIYPKFGTTVAKRFERLAESLKEAIYFVDNITNEISFNKAEFIDINELLETCNEKGIQNELFDFEPFFDKDTFIIDGEEQKPIIRFSKLDFFELYNNILENAIEHGFTDLSKKYLFKTELKYDQEFNKVVISFLNNGKPFPKGMAERYQIKGEKAGATGNKGIGSWKVFEIAKHFGAEINVHDLAGEEFPVRIDLLLNLENE